MLPLKVTSITVGIGLLAVIATVRTASALDYTFTKIADSAIDDIDPFSTGAPSLSDMGHVAFGALTADQSESRVFRTGPGLAPPLAVLADTVNETQVGTFFRNVSVNNNGQVSVWATVRGARLDEAIYRADGGPLEEIALAGDDEPFSFMSVITSINDSGLVTWQGELNQSGFPQGLFTGDGDGVDILFSTASSDFTSSFAGPAINSAGQIAFRASTITSSGDAIFRYDGGSTFTTIVDSSGPFSAAFDDEPAINNAGRVLVIGSNSDLSVNYLIVGDGTAPAQPVVDTSGELESFSGAAINDSDQIAFVASLDDFVSQALYGGPDLVNDRIIGTGDELDGSTVSFVSMYREGLNNAGQIAFFAGLNDGRGVIMVATPAAAPCPGDVNGDGVVDLADLATLLVHFGILEGATREGGDLDGDGDVDLTDLATLLANFGDVCR